LFGYLFGFFSESTNNAIVTAVNYDFLLGSSGVPLSSFAYLNLHDKKIRFIPNRSMGRMQLKIVAPY